MLVQELREEFDRETAKTGRARLLLTMAVPAGIEYIDKGFDVPKLNRYRKHDDDLQVTPLILSGSEDTPGGSRGEQYK
ncbi:unnamed protein product, partial [Timema podura]|nr:unnamed protein product [Timema podura]